MPTLSPAKIKFPTRTICNGVEGLNYYSHFKCISEDNEFIPISSLTDGELIVKEKAGEIVDRTFLYSLNVPESLRVITKFSSFCAGLEDANQWKSIKSNNIIDKYYSALGLIVHADKYYTATPLMALCVRRDQLFNINRENPDPSQFCLVIDNNFINNPEHFKVFRNVNKQYIEKMSKLVDVMYTNDLKRVAFKERKLQLPQFQTLIESMQYLRDINQIFKS